MEPESLYIKHAQVNRAPHMRRRTYRAHGRINRKSRTRREAAGKAKEKGFFVCVCPLPRERACLTFITV